MVALQEPALQELVWYSLRSPAATGDSLSTAVLGPRGLIPWQEREWGNGCRTRIKRAKAKNADFLYSPQFSQNLHFKGSHLSSCGVFASGVPSPLAPTPLHDQHPSDGWCGVPLLA
ncbi:hypothetical protein BTVI_142235 [Pitangus sulphuratus]|nr:hypothetical protein BTVI_142235 [Pitangus sulphuratus]